MVLAAVVTASAGLAIALPVVTIYRATDRAGYPVTVERGEIITFVKPAMRRAMPLFVHLDQMLAFLKDHLFP